MSTNELTLTISFTDYPMLKSLKKKDAEKMIVDIFNAGYKSFFPNKEEMLKKHEFEQIKNSINEQIEPLNNSLNKLLGLQTASSKKGELGENIIQNIFATRYGDLLYEDKSGVAHSGDAWVYLPNNDKIMIESKNYTSTISKTEVEKMEYDMKFNHIRFALFLSCNAQIQGFREMDMHTFVYNNETYFAIMISNFTNDISRIDIAFVMIRKLMDLLNNPEKFPWIQKKIQENLNKVNEITIKNYILRESFYDLEKSIQGSLDLHHKKIRDYQYEMEQLVSNLTIEINSTMTDSMNQPKNIKDILLVHKSNKIYPVISHISDLIEKKKWNLKETSANKYDMYNKDTKLGSFEVTLKKAVINFPHNQLDLIFNAGNSKQNSQNLKILETNF